jgi:hypothetical protein
VNRTWTRVLCFLLVAWAAPTFAVELELLRFPVEGGELRFKTSAPRELAELPIDREGAGVQTVVTPHYTVYADLDSIEYAERGGYFRYKMYVEPRPGTPGPVAGFIVKGIPVGSFPPQMGDVELTLRGDVTEQGMITLPVFSLDEPKYLKVKEWTEPEEIELPGGGQVFLPLDNLLRLPVKVLEMQQPESGSLWRKAALQQTGGGEFKPFQIGPGAKTRNLLALDLQPGPQAIFKALFSKVRTGEHDLVQAALVCATPWENLPRQTLIIAVPVRFVPWPPILFLSVAFGTLLGSFIPVLLGRRDRVHWLRAFLLSLLVAFVFEVVAMVLVQFDSQFRLLGFEMDPFQLLPATLIGMVMGLLGFKSLEALRKIIPLRDSDK